MAQADKEQAVKWYVAGYNLQTIADHFHVTVSELKSSIHYVSESNRNPEWNPSNVKP